MKTIKDLPLSTHDSSTIGSSFLIVSGVGSRDEFTDRIAYPIFKKFLVGSLEDRLAALETTLGGSGNGGGGTGGGTGTNLDGFFKAVEQLKTDVAVIRASIEEERIVRVTADQAEAIARRTLTAQYQTDIANVQASVRTEQIARANAFEALASSTLKLEAKFETDYSLALALIEEERIARATALSAEAIARDKLRTELQLGDSLIVASVETERKARVDALAAEASAREALRAEFTNGGGATEAMIETERKARADAISAEASSREALDTKFTNQFTTTLASIEVERKARSDGDAAEASAREALDTKFTNALATANASIEAERKARSDADGAEALSREALDTKFTNGLATANAAIETERTARSDAIAAEVVSREALEAKFNTDLATTVAAIETERKARADGDAAEASAREALRAEFTGYQDSATSAALEEEKRVRATAIAAEASAREALRAKMESDIADTNAAIVDERKIRSDANTATAQRLSVMESNGGFALGLNPNGDFSLAGAGWIVDQFDFPAIGNGAGYVASSWVGKRAQIISSKKIRVGDLNRGLHIQSFFQVFGAQASTYVGIQCFKSDGVHIGNVYVQSSVLQPGGYQVDVTIKGVLPAGSPIFIRDTRFFDGTHYVSPLFFANYDDNGGPFANSYTQITQLWIEDVGAVQQVNARVTTEENARVKADEALATRNTKLEAQMNRSEPSELGRTITVVDARVTTEESARATADAALATRSTKLEASYTGISQIVANDYFDNGVEGWTFGSNATGVASSGNRRNVIRTAPGSRHDGVVGRRIPITSNDQRWKLKASWRCVAGKSTYYIGMVFFNANDEHVAARDGTGNYPLAAGSVLDSAIHGWLDREAVIGKGIDRNTDFGGYLNIPAAAVYMRPVIFINYLDDPISVTEFDYFAVEDVTAAEAANARITAEETARASADSALATRNTTLEAKFNTAGGRKTSVVTADMFVPSSPGNPATLPSAGVFGTTDIYGPYVEFSTQNASLRAVVPHARQSDLTVKLRARLWQTTGSPTVAIWYVAYLDGSFREIANGLIGTWRNINDYSLNDIDNTYAVPFVEGSVWIRFSVLVNRLPSSPGGNTVPGAVTRVLEATVEDITAIKLTDAVTNARITAEEKTRADAVSALATRNSTLEAQVTGTVSSGLQTMIKDNRRNLADVAWWKFGATIPWSKNGGSVNMIYTLPSSSWPTIMGPSGSADDVWLCRADGGGNEGGGWNGGQMARLDPDRTYRFAVPILGLDNGKRTSYWGANGVCDLNTTNLQGNPYFAVISNLIPPQWHLFVGYLFPRNSTGNSHDGAGIWNMETGAKISAGLNYCFHPDGRQPVHRAYQYYAADSVYQAFGRPMVELVDGTETNFESALAAKRGAVSANARITAEETARATADSALATRANSLEATVFNGPNQNSTLSSRITNEESARATAVNALAQRSTLLEAYGGKSPGLILNGNFSTLPNRNPGTIPTYWQVWASESPVLRKWTTAPGIESEWAMYDVVEQAGQQQGLYQDVRAGTGWYVIEATIEVWDGSLAGTGILLYALDSNGGVRTQATLSFATEPPIGKTPQYVSLASGGAQSGVLRYAKLVNLGADDATAGQYTTSLRLYAMSNWDGFGTSRSYKQMAWHKATVRPATDAEVKGHKALPLAENAQARVGAEELARVTADNALASRTNFLEAQMTGVNDSYIFARTRNEETARADADSALSSRISTTEAQFRGDTDSPILARLRSEETARANTDGALATRIDSVQANYVSKVDLAAYDMDMDFNAATPVNDAWAPAYHGGGTLDSRINKTIAWNNASCLYLANYSVRAEVYSRRSIPVNPALKYRMKARFGAYFNGGTGTTSRFYIGFVGLDANGAVVDHGSYGSYRYSICTGEAITDGQIVERSVIVTGEGNDSWLKFPPNTRRIRPLIFMNYDQYNIHSYVDYISIEEITEIDAQVTAESTARANADGALASRATSVEARAGSLESRTGINETAIADARNKLASARLELSAVTSGGRAAITLRSDNNSGAGVDIVGDVNFSGNLNVGPDSGQRVKITNSGVTVFDGNGTLRVRLGLW